MIFVYKVFYDGQPMGQVRAYSKQSAIDQAYAKTGGASALSGKALRLYTATRVY